MIDLNVPESEKTKEWYKKIVMAYAINYNRPMSINNELLTPAQIIARNRLYYYGEQDIGK